MPIKYVLKMLTAGEGGEALDVCIRKQAVHHWLVSVVVEVNRSLCAFSVRYADVDGWEFASSMVGLFGMKRGNFGFLRYG